MEMKDLIWMIYILFFIFIFIIMYMKNKFMIIITLDLLMIIVTLTIYNSIYNYFFINMIFINIYSTILGILMIIINSRFNSNIKILLMKD